MSVRTKTAQLEKLPSKGQPDEDGSSNTSAFKPEIDSNKQRT